MTTAARARVRSSRAWAGWLGLAALVGCWSAPEPRRPGGGPPAATADDRDGDGLTDAREAALGTDPDRADSDGDGQLDGVEVDRWGTDPRSADSDCDGVPDGAELRAGTDPIEPHDPLDCVAPPSTPEPPEAARCAPESKQSDCWSRVEGATFRMGAQAERPGEPGYDPEAQPDEGPPHEVSVRAFWMHRAEATVADFRACLDAGVCREDDVSTGGFSTWSREGARDDLPINGITWDGARRLCAFEGGRLPTEAEWELAARGAEGRRWPWGDAPGCGVRKGVGSAMGTENDVMRPPPCENEGPRPNSELFGRSRDGIDGLAGNVWEWVEDRYGPYPSTPTVDPRGPEQGDRRVQRGGGWTAVDPSELRAAARSSLPADARINDVGVRCVWGRRAR